MNRPTIMGILNVTPDSFSGDGKLADAAIANARLLMGAGADILDIGAESTRPNAKSLTDDEEWARLEPVLSGIIEESWRPRVRLSIDTRHAQTAARALDMGIEIINDVSGLVDDAMLEVLEEHDCDIVVMHALGIPADPKVMLPENVDVVDEILAWKAAVTTHANARGVPSHRLIYDPGIGFGKTADQSLALVQRAGELKRSGGRWLYGHSRKSFMKLLTDAPVEARDGLTLQFSEQLARDGIDYLRVHDVIGHVNRFDALCT
jgi:dihydropteroate synthase